MSRCFILAAAIFSTGGLTLVHAQTKEPENGQALAKVLNDKYNLGCAVDNDGNIFVASFNAREVGDVQAALDRIAEISTLQRLQINHAHLNRESFIKLRSLPDLSALRLLYCKFEDGDLDGLKDLSLKELDLTGTPITDAGLAFLEPLKNLGRLKLSNTKITGSGFKHLESLPLQELNLTATPIDDDSLKSIGKILTLRTLDLSHSSITDDGLLHVAGLFLLHQLNLDETQTTHAGRDWFWEEYNKTRTNAEQNGLVPKSHPELVIIEN